MIDKPKFIYIYAGLFSLLLSAYCIFMSDTINPDGIFYLRIADAYLHSGLSGALSIYKWPFFPITIAYFSKLSHLSLIHSGFVLTSLFQMMLVLGFISIHQLFLKSTADPNYQYSKLILILAAATILLFPHLNDYRDYIIRDFGYWGFFIFAVKTALAYFRSPTWCKALLWWVLTVIACNFRVEGVVFIPLLPFLALLQRGTLKTKITQCLQLSMPSIVLCCIAVIAFISYKGTPDLGRLNEVFNAILSGFTPVKRQLHIAAELLSPAVHGDKGIDNVPTIIQTGIIGYYLVKIVKGLSIVVFIAVFYGIFTKKLPAKRSDYIVIFGYMLVIFVATVYFLVTRFFLSERYMFPLLLLLLLWFPYSALAIYHQWQAKQAVLWRNTWVMILLLAILSFNIADGLITIGPSKAYIRDAGRWLKSTVKPTDRIYTNSPQLMFYAMGTPSTWDDDVDRELLEFKNIIKNKQTGPYTYYAIRVKSDHHQKELIETINLPLLKKFSNHKCGRILIFKASSDTNQTKID